MSADAHTIPTPQATYAQRVAFVSEIAGRLHSYGTTAQRLETAVVALARQLDLDCEPWSNPTGIILSFSDPAQAIGSSDITRVIRLAPGENDLHKLSVADHIAEEVANGRMSIAQGHTALRQLDKDPGRRGRRGRHVEAAVAGHRHRRCHRPDDRPARHGHRPSPGHP